MSNQGTGLPQSLEAEIGVLGSLLLEKDIAGEVIQLLHKNYFSLLSHQLIFEAICTLFEQNKPIDPVSVQEQLKKSQALDKVGQDYIFKLMETVYSAGNVTFYANVIREKGIMRELIKAADEIIEYTKKDSLELDNLLDKAEQLVFEVTQKKVSSEPCQINHIVRDILLNIERENYGLQGTSTGFSELDEMTSGLQKAALIIIAGRPSMGKTSFALNIASHIGIDQQKAALVFSLEMSKEQVGQNIICSRTGVSPHKITSGKIQHDEYERLTTEAGTIENARIFIDDSPSLSIRELRAKARRYKAIHDISLVVIDYVQLMECPGKQQSENRQQEIAQISRGLKSIARELSIPIIALSQLNRSVDARDDHRPRLSDLRESGALEQDADIIVFLYRDEYYNKDSPHPGIAEVIVAKNRNGPTGSIELYFHKEYMRFTSISHQRSI